MFHHFAPEKYPQVSCIPSAKENHVPNFHFRVPLFFCAVWDHVPASKIFAVVADRMDALTPSGAFFLYLALAVVSIVFVGGMVTFFLGEGICMESRSF